MLAGDGVEHEQRGREHVRRSGRRGALQLLRGEPSLLLERVVELGHREVADLDAAREHRADEDVRGLQAQVEHALVVGRVEDARQLVRQRDALTHRERAQRDERRERRVPRVLGGHEAGARVVIGRDLENAQDVRRRERFELAHAGRERVEDGGVVLPDDPQDHLTRRLPERRRVGARACAAAQRSLDRVPPGHDVTRGPVRRAAHGDEDTDLAKISPPGPFLGPARGGARLPG